LSITSNLPRGFYQREDDNGDGYYEEAEVTAMYSWLLVAEYTYYAHLGFNTHSIGWTKFQHSSQCSLPIPPGDPSPVESDPLQDFEAYIFDTIQRGLAYLAPGTIPVSYPVSVSKEPMPIEDQIIFFGSLTDQCRYTVYEKGPNRYKVNIWPILNDKEDFNQYSSWLSTRIEEITELSSDDPVPVVITFNHSIPIDDFAAFVMEHNIMVDSFEVKVYTSNDEEWTIYGAPNETALLDQKTFETMLSCIQSDTGDDNLQVAGINAIWGNVPSHSLTSLQETDGVLLVDVSPTFVLQRVQELGFTGSIVYSIPDLYESIRFY
jgi:hypothetical protein